MRKTTLQNTLNTPFPLGKTGILGILLMCFLLGACAGQSEITKAYNIVNAVSAVRNGLQPIYDEVVKQHPDLADEIQAFDAELHDAILSTYDVLIAIKKGEATYADYSSKIVAIVSIIERYHVEEKVPQLKPGIDLIKRLLLGEA